MSSWKPKATRKRMISCFAQIVQEHIPGWKIEEIASEVLGTGPARFDSGRKRTEIDW